MATVPPRKRFIKYLASGLRRTPLLRGSVNRGVRKGRSAVFYPEGRCHLEQPVPALVDYISPRGATGRKDAVQVYAVIVAGVIASIAAAVGLLNLRLTRRNLEQQRELEAQRAQGTALQAYYEQIGKLITDVDLLKTQRKEIRELARGQTLTVLQEVRRKRQGEFANLPARGGADRSGEPGSVALTGADLRGASLEEADLAGAILHAADIRGATMPDGSKHS